MDFATKVSLLVFLPMLALPAWLYWMAARVERRIEAARYWPRATATVTNTRIGRAKSSFWPEVHFDYQAGGKTYRSKRLGFVQESRSKAECEAVLEQYTPGTKVQAWYDPDKPSFAVLERAGDGRSFRIAAFATGAAALLTFIIVLVTLYRA